MSNSIFVGTRKGLFEITRSASQFSVNRTNFLGVQIPIVAPVGGGLVFALQKHGHFGPKMQRSADNGNSWEEIAVPTFPEKPDDVPDVMDPFRHVPVPWSIELLWSMARGNDRRLWCGTIPGALFTSDDDGGSWQLNEPMWNEPARANWFGGGFDWPGIHSICVDPNNAQRVTLGVSCGGVWQSDDRGSSWRCIGKGLKAEYMPPERQEDPTIQDPHLLVQCPARPDHLWTQHHNGIFRSTDYGESWSELPKWEPSTFGFAAAVHPTDSETAWFVPAISDEVRYPRDGRFVVTRTRDGGRTCEVLSAGLPQQDAYHIVFRHALAVSEDGNSLAMGSSTGGLWVSDSTGDDWQLVTQDLPPVYCVEFGKT